MAKIIRLTQGKVTLVDDDDYEWLNQWKWQFAINYARRTDYTNGKKNVFMHRIILDAPNDYRVDHINGDKLDNRRENLRLATFLENAQNSKIRKDNKSGYKGVHWHKASGKWAAKIRVNNRSIHFLPPKTKTRS